MSASFPVSLPSSSYFVHVFDRPIRMFFGSIPVAEVQFTRASRYLTLRVPSPLTRLFVHARTVVGMFPMSTGHATFYRHYFRSRQVPRVAILTVSDPTGMRIANFLTSVSRSYSTRDRVSFVRLGVRQLIDQCFVSYLRRYPIPSYTELSKGVPRTRHKEFFQGPMET